MSGEWQWYPEGVSGVRWVGVVSGEWKWCQEGRRGVWAV